MELRQLRYFVSLAQAKTFSEAAKQVHVSQPALSQQIKNLETELESQLVERMGKKIKLTRDGQQLLPEAMKVLDAVRTASASVSSNNNLNGSLNLGIIPTIAPYFLPDLLEILNPEDNELNLFIEEKQTDSLIEQLKIGMVDHILLSPPIPEEGLITKDVGDEPFYLAVSEDEPITERDSIDIDEIDDEPVLLLEEGHCLRDQTLSFCERKNVNPNIVFQGSSLQSILNLIKSGLGYTFVPKMVVDHQHYEKLEFISVTNPEPSRKIILARRQSTELTSFDRKIYDRVEQWFMS